MINDAESKNPKTRVAFVKFGGMTIGGSELWIQKMAVNLPKENLEIDYYYCDDTPYIGGDHTPAESSPERIEYLRNNGVNVIKFSVKAKDIRTLTHDWVDTDFWEKFDESKYDLIQTVKAGPKEYPFYKMTKPVIEIVALANRPDTSKNIAWSFHSSNWQRAQWVRIGGSINKSSVLTSPIETPQSTENYRMDLGIPDDAIVAGFHQRNDDLIFSPIPLNAFAALRKKYPAESKNWHFIIKNGSGLYRDQAKRLGLENVHFLGRTPDSASVSKFLNTLDIFAHGRADGETFGAIFVEAMMHGKPCISHYSPDGANAQPETMGPAGVFAMNESEYADLLGRLFTDGVYRNKLASKAKSHVESYYSMDKCIAETIEIYERVSGKKISDEKYRQLTLHRPIPYGYSDMGFLYAGDMNKIDNIAYHVLYGGIPEAFDVAIVRALLPFTNTFYDVGANTGIYCWVAAQHYAKRKDQTKAKVYAFEPQADCVTALEATRTLNNWEDIVEILPIGIGDRPGKGKLYLSGTGSSLTDDFAGKDLPAQTIEIKTLDSLRNEPADFIKVDVEGFELAVLHGAAETISKDKPILFIEIANRIKSRNFKNEKYAETLAWLKDHGYRIWKCHNNAIEEIDARYDGDPQIDMYLCLHKEKHADLVPIFADAVKAFRSENLIFGLVEKRLVRKAIRKIIPPYITVPKLIAYAKRMLRL